MKEKRKKLSRRVVAIIVAAVILGMIALTGISLQIAFVVADGIECWHPDYEKKDITAILDKQTLTAEDYTVLYEQTGLTEIGIDRLLARGDGVSRILRIQNDFFTEHTVTNEFFAPLVCQDKIEKHVEYAELENGDILISSSTHLSGWRIGHAGLVTDGAAGRVLQASAIGNKSAIGSVRDFTNRVNFMIFSPKADKSVKNEVAEYAKNNLTGKTYDPTAGVFSSKNNAAKTQCAHIVWYAYKQFGIDLDSNGGLVVTPKNIAGSDEVELVQVFGFDPRKLWK